MTEKKPARRSAERATTLNKVSKSNISKNNPVVNVSKEIGLCRHWEVHPYFEPGIKSGRVGKCKANGCMCSKRLAQDLLYLRCRVYLFWLQANKNA